MTRRATDDPVRVVSEGDDEPDSRDAPGASADDRCRERRCARAGTVEECIACPWSDLPVQDAGDTPEALAFADATDPVRLADAPVGPRIYDCPSEGGLARVIDPGVIQLARRVATYGPELRAEGNRGRGCRAHHDQRSRAMAADGLRTRGRE